MDEVTRDNLIDWFGTDNGMSFEGIEELKKQILPQAMKTHIVVCVDNICLCTKPIISVYGKPLPTNVVLPFLYFPMYKYTIIFYFLSNYILF